MKINVSPDYGAMSLATAGFIADYIQRKPNALLCLPSGETPTGTLQYLVEYANAGRIDFSQCRFVGLDEWVGMGKEDEGSCQQYIYAHFFNQLNHQPANVAFFDARSAQLLDECRRIDDYIRQYGPIDIMLVGVGMNGHIGLNEPGTSFDLYAHWAELDPITKTVGQKYFGKATPLERGITLGLRHFLEADTAVLIASGAKKAEVIAKAIKGEVTNGLPASIIQIHANGYVFLDESAASKLE